MRILLTTLFFLAAQSVFAFGAVNAQTWDGLTPSEELVCDGLEGREFGLCNAYCEAIDCDSQLDPPNACNALRANFYRASGSYAFPCDQICPDVPDETCSGNGVLVGDVNECNVCECDENFSGADCSTCDVGFDACGVCGGEDIEFCD